ncbi:MAG: DUF1257 domain-containing protein [Cyanobium sp.]
MSHLSILPTVLRDVACLSETLQSFGLQPEQDAVIEGFGGESLPVLLAVRLAEGASFGWSRSADGSLALVGDLQRLSRCRDLQRLLGRLTRAYAARAALGDASRHNALIEFGA